MCGLWHRAEEGHDFDGMSSSDGGEVTADVMIRDTEELGD